MHLHEPEIVGNWWPLSDGSIPAEQFVAGKTIREWQQLTAPEPAHLHSNAWVCAEDWKLLADHPKGTKLVSSNNEVLGWIGQHPLESTIEASEHSFLLFYPWHLLFVNEQIVGALTENVTHGEVSPAAHIEGFIEVGEGTRILPGVFIEGNAIIGKNCKIGPNCYIRGNTSIADGVHIGQAVEVKNSIVGNGSSVGHLSYVGDSVIGTKVNFGAATVTSNLRHDGLNHRSLVDQELVNTGRRKFGTVVGDNVHTGIHTAIYPGRKLGPNTSTRPNQDVQKDLI